MSLTFHQTFTMMDSIAAIESGKAGETDHRTTVERQARRMRLSHE